MWNEKNPDRKIDLTYIPHAEMVAKLAQAIASGEVPDLMGMDLIYAPQFESAGQLVDITDKFKDWPDAEDRQPGSHDGRDLRRTASTACRSTPTSRRSSTTTTCSRRPGSTRTSRRPALPKSAHDADKITALGGDVKGYFLPGLMRRLQHLYRRPADVGVRRQHRSRSAPRTSRWSAMAQGGPSMGPRHDQVGQCP